MIPPSLRLTTGVLFLALLTACTNIKNDTTRTKAEGTMAGGAAGAIAGGFLAALMSGGSPDAIARGAVSGAMTGATAGYYYGASVASKKEEYASAEAYLDACIVEVKQQTERSRAYNSQAERIVARQERQLATMLAGDPGLRSAQAQTLREQADLNLTNLDTGLMHWQLIIQAHKEVVRRTRRDSRRDALAGSIPALELERTRLQKNRERFVSVRDRIPK